MTRLLHAHPVLIAGSPPHSLLPAVTADEGDAHMSTEKPEVDFPGGEPPADLEISDIWPGDGAEAKAGDTVQVHYVGVAFSTGEEFDASWNRGDPLEFRLGAGQVIQGWDRGVQGMRVGGRRQLIIPPHLAYGDRGAGRVIAPGETLIFVCDLVSA
jgi:peptidylprolyl isomerase